MSFPSTYVHMYLFMLQVFATPGWVKGHVASVCDSRVGKGSLGLHTVIGSTYCGHVANCMTQHVVCVFVCVY